MVSDRPVEVARPEAHPEVAAALAELPTERRVVVVLRIVAGLSPAETAAALGVPVGSVHSRLHRGLADLRVALEVKTG